MKEILTGVMTPEEFYQKMKRIKEKKYMKMLQIKFNFKLKK